MKLLSTPKRKLGHEPISLIVMHYTVLNFEDSVKVLTDPKSSAASCHFLVDTNGDVYQMAPLECITNHAGESWWKGRHYVNPFSVGIEMVNDGYLFRKKGKFLHTVYRTPVLEEDTVELDGKVWRKYPDVQRAAAVQLVHSILMLSYRGAKRLAFPLSTGAIVGHCDVSPDRKVDPGPAFNLEYFRKECAEFAGDTLPIIETEEDYEGALHASLD